MPPGWKATRARILARDHYRCGYCGGTAAEVHHISRGTEADWNLIAVCDPCHTAITQQQAAAARTAARQPPATIPARTRP
jgi:5-methylcytosine-specific restriction endonuclease McrA